MSSLWCPECGAEYLEGKTVCADDGAELVATPPGSDDGMADEDEGGEVIVYELDEWTADQRGALELRLQTADVEHQWETAEGADVEAGYEPGQPWEVATELVVGEQDEELVDGMLDEIEAPDALVAVEADDDEGEDEADYAVMSHLYVAADRLKDDPGDLALAGEFFDAADAAGGIDAPFGIDADVWRRVQEMAGEVSGALEKEDEEGAVSETAQRLRDVLFSYV